MKRNIMRVALASVFLTALVAPSNAAINIYNVMLNGSNEAPPNASPGMGIGLVTVDTTLQTMIVNLTFSGLTANTSAAHIHATTAVALTGTAGVASDLNTVANPFPLGVTSGNYTGAFNMLATTSYGGAFLTANGGNTTTAFGTLLSAMDAGKSYINVHTTAFPGGEIRGFLVAAPEPSTMALFAIGGVGVFLRRRRAVTV
jgi:hypothetical protein